MFGLGAYFGMTRLGGGWAKGSRPASVLRLPLQAWEQLGVNGLLELVV